MKVSDVPVSAEGIPLIYISSKMANRILNGAGIKRRPSKNRIKN